MCNGDVEKQMIKKTKTGRKLEFPKKSKQHLNIQRN